MFVLGITQIGFAAENDISVIFNGTQLTFDVPPQIINDNTMVPMRAIFEAFGATVEWDNDTNTASAYKDDRFVRLTIGDANMYINDEAVPLETPACVINDRTLVPVRAVSQAFNLGVQWNEYMKQVIIDEIPYYDTNALLAQVKADLSIPDRDTITYTISEPDYKMALREYVVWFKFYENDTEMASASWCLTTQQYYTRYSDF